MNFWNNIRSEIIKVLAIVCMFVGLAVIVVAGVSGNYIRDTLMGLITVFIGTLGFYTTSEKIRNKKFRELLLKDLGGLLGFGTALVIGGYFGQGTFLSFIVNFLSPIVLLVILTAIQAIAWRLGDWIFDRTVETTYADNKQG